MPDNLFYPPKKGDYVYFEMPRFHPGFPEIVQAAWTADAAMLAYARYQKQRMGERDFRDILARAGYSSVATIGDFFSDGADTARAFFASNQTHGLLAFRGTEKDDANDIDADADIFLAEEAGALVHRGFQQYLDAVWPRVKEVVDDYRRGSPQREICMTGHSLGAALASLAFTRMVADPATSLFTFGCPRVGNKEYCNRILAASRTRRCYRVVDRLDVVTHVPTGPIYQHPAITQFWLNGEGGLISNPEDPPGDWIEVAGLARGFGKKHWSDGLPVPLPSPLADHSPVRYCYWVGEAALAAGQEGPPD